MEVIITPIIKLKILCTINFRSKCTAAGLGRRVTIFVHQLLDVTGFHTRFSVGMGKMMCMEPHSLGYFRNLRTLRLLLGSKNAGN